VDLKTGAEQVCKTKYKDAKATYPLIYEDSLPYACLDLIYQYTLFVDGFGKFACLKLHSLLVYFHIQIKMTYSKI